jgi:hypothetical protein
MLLRAVAFVAHVHGILHRILQVTGLHRAFTFTAQHSTSWRAGGMPGFTRWA